MTPERRVRYRDGSPQRRASDLGWAAGVVDSEGSVRLTGGTAVLKVDMAVRPCLDRLAALFGGRVRPNKGGRGARRPVHRWQVSGGHARQVMAALLPYLVEKADQVALILTVQTNRRGKMLTGAQRAGRAAVAAELARMKRVSY